MPNGSKSRRFEIVFIVAPFKGVSFHNVIKSHGQPSKGVDCRPSIPGDFLPSIPDNGLPSK